MIMVRHALQIASLVDEPLAGLVGAIDQELAAVCSDETMLRSLKLQRYGNPAAEGSPPKGIAEVD
jgi:hypothetical protein